MHTPIDRSKLNVLRGCTIHDSCMIYGNCYLGNNCIILENVMLGYPDAKTLAAIHSQNIDLLEKTPIEVRIGDNALIRPGSVIYCGVTIGENLRTGHNIMVRENTRVGNNVLIGTNVVIDGDTAIGNRVSIQSNVYIPTNTLIEDNVFLGPCTVLTNDKYPIRVKYDLKGPIIRKGASIGANSTILPGIEIGEGSFVAAGALVTKNVPAGKLAIGFPARVVDLPDNLKSYNLI